MYKESFFKKIFGRKIISIETDKIFSFLASVSHHPDAIENYLFQYNRLKRKYRGDDNIFINLYLNWEEFIVNNKTETFRNYNTESLRVAISKEVNLHYISESFRLIFIPKKDQALSLYKIFVLKISDYINEQLGHITLVNCFKNIQDPFLAKIKITENSISFELIDDYVKNNLNTPIDEITKSFKHLVNVFYNTIELSLGSKVTHDIFNKMIMEFKQRYNAELTSVILKIIPERVLGMDEWLSLMSKKELERQVREKTEELSSINSSLEETVAKRTSELQKAYDDLKKLDQKKTEFISVAAHQLRTPLSGIKWGLTMLKSGELGKLTDEQKEFIQKSIDTNDKIIKIVNDLLDIDLYTKDEINYDFENIDIVNIIDNSVKELSNQALRKNININWKKPSDKIIIDADLKKISIVIQNIIDNAIKYSEEKTEIKIDTLKVNSQVQISIKNKGIGISEEDKEQIFQRFFRAKNAIRKETEGTGVGLFITKNIIEDHGGRIWFESKKDGETTFFISLPLSQKKISV